MNSDFPSQLMSNRLNHIDHELRRRERAKYDLRYFAEEYWKEDLPGLSGNRGLSYDDPDHHQRFGFMASLLVEFFMPKLFLDAGCGLGVLTDNMARTCDIAVGIDASLCAFTARFQACANIAVAGVEALPFVENSFDLVFCSDVLEHVPVFDIGSALAELGRVSCKWVVLTINLDNPYYYHPTILSRSSWQSLLDGNPQLLQCELVEDALQRRLQAKYPEYDVFVYRHLLGVPE